MAFRIEVLTKTYHVVRGDEENWQPLHGTAGTPYDWSTRREAETMRDLLYPEPSERVRVVEYEAR